MNEHGTAPRVLAHGEALTIAGRPVHELLLAGARELVGLVVSRLAETVPTYAALPREALRGEIASIVELNLGMCAEVLRTGTLPSAELLEALSEGATRRAEEGVPLDAVVSAYHIGLQLCLDEVLGRAAPEDLSGVLDATAWVLRYLQVTTSAASGGYVLAHQSAAGEEYTARQALLSALLDGVPAEDAAARAGLALPECYFVLSLAVGPHPDELDSGVNSTVAARRKLRRLRVELERHVAGGVLTMLTAEGGLALVPYGTTPDGLDAKDWHRLSGVLDHLTRICGAEVTAGAAAALPAEVPQAARLSAEVREVAKVFARGPGLHRLDDVLLEYQLTRPGPARARLAALLEPLAPRPDLLHTLRVHLDSSLDRRAAAARLQVHPNTVDYRLRKVALLTGLDTGDPADVPRIRAALAAHDAVNPTAGP